MVLAVAQRVRRDGSHDLAMTCERRTQETANLRLILDQDDDRFTGRR